MFRVEWTLWLVAIGCVSCSSGGSEDAQGDAAVAKTSASETLAAETSTGTTVTTESTSAVAGDAGFGGRDFTDVTHEAGSSTSTAVSSSSDASSEPSITTEGAPDAGSSNTTSSDAAQTSEHGEDAAVDNLDASSLASDTDGGTSSPAGGYVGESILPPGSELFVPDGCEVVSNVASDIYFGTGIVCGDAGESYAWSSCNREPDAWYCTCDKLPSATKFVFTGVSEAELGTFAANFCTRLETLQPVGPAQCDVWSEVSETGACGDHQRCWQNVELLPDVDVHVESQRNNLSCSENGTDKWSCGCEAYPERNVSVLSADQSAACEGFRDVCFEELELDYGPGTCELTYTGDEFDNACSTEETCTVVAPLPNGAVAEANYEQTTTCSLQGTAWDCYCSSLHAFANTRFDDDGNARCGEALRPCVAPDAVTFNGDYDCSAAGEVSVITDTCSQEVDCVKSAHYEATGFEFLFKSLMTCQPSESGWSCWCPEPNASFVTEPSANTIEEACALATPSCIEDLERVLNQ